ncbi:MAG: hypothetical protein ACLPVY_00100 [Acidimicrobiia bacterium]
MDEGRRHGWKITDRGFQSVELQVAGLEGDAGELRLVSDHDGLSAQRLARRWDGGGLYLTSLPSRAFFVTDQDVWAGTEPIREPDDGSHVDLAIVQVTRTPRSPGKRRVRANRAAPGDRLAVRARIDALK